MRKIIFATLTLFLMASSCAATLGYKYYGMSGVDYSKGTLVGKTPSDDVSFNYCRPLSIEHPNPEDPAHPTITEQRRCVVLDIDEFSKMANELVVAREKLKACKP
jgi:hypothetical protein